MLLIRGKPLPEESLSSYRQRIWRQNGYRLFPVFPPELRRTDPDLQANAEVLRAVAQMVDIGIENVRRLNAWSHPLLSHQNLAKGRSIPRWIAFLQYARQGIGTGSNFCPICLKNGEEPYFRIHWRLSVTLTCPTHYLRLLNQCPSCALPAWPYAAASAIGYFERDIEIDQCPRCFFLLRDTRGEKETSAYALDCAQAIFTGKISDSDGTSSKVPIAERFCALRSVMNLVLRIRSRKKVYADAVFGEVAAIFDRDGISSMPFDRLRIDHRRILVTAAWPLLLDWPSRFLEFSQRCRITVVDYSEDRHALPTWFIQVIDRNLGRPSRSVSLSQVDAVIHDLKSQGLTVNASRVGQIVGSCDAEPVRKRLSKRNVATFQDTEKLATGLRLYMSSCRSRRISSHIVRARNVIALLVSIICGMKVEEVILFHWPAVQKLVDDFHPNKAINRFLRPVLADAVEVARSKCPLWTDEIDQGQFFKNHSGSSPNLRGPRDALIHAMNHCDFRLWRRTWVFFDPVAVTATDNCESTEDAGINVNAELHLNLRHSYD